MQQQVGFRLGMVMHALAGFLGVDPLASGDRDHIDRVPEHLRPFLPERTDVELFRALRLPLELLGGLWVGQIAQGAEALARLPAERCLTLRYEDLLTEPVMQSRSTCSVPRRRVRRRGLARVQPRDRAQTALELARLVRGGYAVPDYMGERVMQRTVIQGDRPRGPADANGGQLKSEPGGA